MIFKGIINDTLKRDGKWSRTSLTMWSAWMVCLFAFIVDTVKHLGEVNETMFGIMVGVALGSKWVDAKSRSILDKSEIERSNEQK